jgi:Na+/H+-dicarboxylate symporter
LAYFLKPNSSSLPDIAVSVTKVNDDVFALHEAYVTQEAILKGDPKGFRIYPLTLDQIKKQIPVLADEVKALAANQSLKANLEQARISFFQVKDKLRIQLKSTIQGKPFTTNLSVKNAAELKLRYADWHPVYEKYAQQVGYTLAPVAKSIGELFLQLLKMVTIPLIVSSLITSVTGMTNLARMKNMLFGTLFYYFVSGVFAITTGVILVNIIHPGIGVTPFFEEEKSSIGKDESVLSVMYKLLQGLIPANPFQALATGDFLAIISFTMVFSIAVVMSGSEVSKTIHQFFSACFTAIMNLTTAIITLAPYAVFFLIFATICTEGLDILVTLFYYMLTVIFGLLIHGLVFLPLVLLLVARRRPFKFMQQMSPALLTAFSTASSNATLPLTMKCIEKNAGISQESSGFVLPIGANINTDGTALYEAVAVLFIAEMTLGFPLDLGTQLIVAVTTLVTSLGAAGIPHASLVMMAVVLQAVNLPIEAQAVILGVDRLLDMCRTTVNVFSDMTACAVVEKLFGKSKEMLIAEVTNP